MVVQQARLAGADPAMAGVERASLMMVHGQHGCLLVCSSGQVPPVGLAAEPNDLCHGQGQRQAQLVTVNLDSRVVGVSRQQATSRLWSGDHPKVPI
jgi:hypothetical protein